MSEESILPKQYDEVRQKYAAKIREAGNENLAEAIETSTADRLSNQQKIESWIEIFPEHQEELEKLWEDIQELQKDKKKEYNPEAFFETVQGQRTFRNNWLANEIEDKYQFKYVEETQKFYIYTGKKWEDKAERVIKEECNDILQDEYEPRRANKVVDTIKTRSHITTTKQEFRPCTYKIPFKNGVYNLDNGELEDHKPEDNFTHVIPWEYDPDAQCPRINEFLDEILENERDKTTIIETIGYSLLADYPYAHALILFGGGKNGKSVLLELWKQLLSEKNYKEEQLQVLEENRFATQSLYRKLAVFNDDLPGTKLSTGSTLKSLTGGGEVRAEYKNGAHFQFKNFATPVFACNEIPETQDQSDGFFRRWEIINFPYKFVEEPKRDFEKEKMPKDKLLEELTQESEMMGLVNEAIVALEVMREQGGFTYKTDPEDTRGLWKSYSNPVDQFIENCLEQGLTQHDARELDSDQDPNTDLSEYAYDFIKKDDLVFLIDKYCQHFDAKSPSKTKITQKLKNESPYYVQEGRTRQLGSDDSRERVYKFIKFTDEFVDFVLSDEKRPECPYFFENLRVHGREIVQSYQKTRDAQDTKSIGDRILDYIDDNGGEVDEQDVIDDLDEDSGKVDERMQQMLNNGELFRPRPGVVKTI